MIERTWRKATWLRPCCSNRQLGSMGWDAIVPKPDQRWAGSTQTTSENGQVVIIMRFLSHASFFVLTKVKRFLLFKSKSWQENQINFLTPMVIWPDWPWNFPNDLTQGYFFVSLMGCIKLSASIFPLGSVSHHFHQWKHSKQKQLTGCLEPVENLDHGSIL